MTTNNTDWLTFEQKQKIDELGERAYTPSSNANKYRYQLYDYIEQAALQKIDAAIGADDDKRGKAQAPVSETRNKLRADIRKQVGISHE